MSLYRKYTVISVCISLLLACLFTWKHFDIIEKYISTNTTERINFLAELLEKSLKITMIEGRNKDFQMFLETLVDEDFESVRIISETGTILSSSRPFEVGKKINYNSVLNENLPENKTIIRHSQTGKDVYLRVVKFENDHMCRGCHGRDETISGVLTIESTPRPDEYDFMLLLKWAILLIIPVFMVLAGSLYVANRRLVVNPLAILTNYIDALKKGNVSPQPVVSNNDEIGSLAQKANSLASELQKIRSDLSNYQKDSLIHSQKMATIGELAAAVAHEIKNPLAGISGALQVLAEDFPEDSPRKVIYREILEEIERLDMAVKNFLYFARPPEPHFIPSDVPALIRKVAYTLGEQAMKQNVKVTAGVFEIPYTKIDPEQIEKLLLSLGHYQLRLMTEDDELTLSTEYAEDRKEISFSLQSSRESVSNEDSGNLFDPKFMTKRLGSGLGLAISKSIAEIHGGRIEVESAQGIGTIFRVIIPFKR